MFRSLLKKSFSSGNIGFIGTGVMVNSLIKGGPMALNLAKGGYTVYPFDMNEDNITKLQNENIKPAKNIETIAAHCEKIICMLPSSQSSQVVFDAITKFAKPGTLIFESSTIEPL